MNILFISYWGINDGLTSATVIPHVKLLTTLRNVKKVILATIEREKFSPLTDIGVIEHIPLISKSFGNVLVNKISDFVRFPNELMKIVKQKNIGLIICRSSLAGGIGYIVSKKTKVPFIVESFEPHAQYMVESEVWSKYDPRTLIEKYFQQKQAATARFLLPVANNYAARLIAGGVEKQKIIVLPCTIDLDVFDRKENKNFKESIAKVGTIIGIYVGKFGGMYYDEEAFEIFAQAKTVFPQFCIVILTPSDIETVESNLLRVGFLKNEFRVIKAKHENVPAYLSMADFAFATYKRSDSKKYLSPIKVGEYWACGLPVLLTRGVGDDSEIIEKSGCGATFVFTQNEVQLALESIGHQLKDTDVRIKNRQLAVQYRNPQILKDAYKKVLGSLEA